MRSLSFGPRLTPFAPVQIIGLGVGTDAVKVVKVVVAKNHPCKWLTLNGVKPSQGKSNQLDRGVKVQGWAAKFARLGWNVHAAPSPSAFARSYGGQAALQWGRGRRRRSDKSWQYVTPAGGLGDNIWQGVPDIVSYSQINSPIVTFGHVLGENIFSSQGHPAESPGAVPRGQIQSDTSWELFSATATPTPLQPGCERLDTIVTHAFLGGTAKRDFAL